MNESYCQSWKGSVFLGGSAEDGLALAQQLLSEEDQTVNVLSFAGHAASAVILSL